MACRRGIRRFGTSLVKRRRRLSVALDVDAVAIRQRRWWRHTVHGADPLARRLLAPDNRWQRGATVDALYLASELGCSRAPTGFTACLFHDTRHPEERSSLLPTVLLMSLSGEVFLMK